jgi:hypothetical protein
LFPLLCCGLGVFASAPCLSYQTNAVSQYSSHAKTNRCEQFRYEKTKSGIQNHFLSPVDVWSKIGRRDELALLPRLPNIRAANKSGSYRKTIAPVGFNGNKVKRLHSRARRSLLPCIRLGHTAKNSRIVTTCGYQYKTMPDRILKPQALPSMKYDAL